MVIIFNELFIIIVVGLALIAGFLMTSYSRKNVKRKQLDIGIFRAIGGKNKHVYQIFFVQNLTMVIIIGIVVLMTIIGYIADKTDFGKQSIKKEKTKGKNQLYYSHRRVYGRNDAP